LPDFLAAKLPGLLESIEDTVATAFSAKNMEAAADALRGLDVSLPCALAGYIAASERLKRW